MSAKPPLVLVQGAPGSGKTTLARELARTLRLPFISRDGLKEAMSEYARFESLADSERFGLGVVGVFYCVAAELTRGGSGAVLDSAFPRGMAERELAPALAASTPVQVYCDVPTALCAERYVARLERGERHACHFEAERIERVRSGARVVDWTLFEPLEIDAPLLRVDTTSGFRPDLDSIATFVREATAQPTEIVYPKKTMAAGALLFDARGHLLLVKPTYRDHWSIPGGVIEEGESPRSGCAREVREEIGLDVTPGPMLVVDYPSVSSAPTGRETVQFLFEGGELSAQQIAAIKLPPAELSAFRFVPVEEAPALLRPRLARRLPHALRAREGGGAVYVEDGAQ